MQFEVAVKLLGVRRQVVENRAFVNFFVSEETAPEDAANGCSGLHIKKIPADEGVIAMLPPYKPGQDIKLVCILKSAAGGKSQPHVIGVSQAGAAPKASA